jgi:hypothetical protein
MRGGESYAGSVSGTVLPRMIMSSYLRTPFFRAYKKGAHPAKSPVPS